MNTPLRPSYADTAQLVRDLKAIFDAVPATQLFELSGLYYEGLTLALHVAPTAIELIRCVNARAPGTTTGHGTAVEFLWTASGARILRIDGLTPSSTSYVFTFRLTY